MVFYHKKAVRVHKPQRCYQISIYGDTTPAMSSLLKPQLFTEGQGPIKSPTMPYMAVTSIVKALTSHPCDGHPDHSLSKMSYDK